MSARENHLTRERRDAAVRQKNARWRFARSTIPEEKWGLLVVYSFPIASIFLVYVYGSLCTRFPPGWFVYGKYSRPRESIAGGMCPRTPLATPACFGWPFGLATALRSYGLNTLFDVP